MQGPVWSVRVLQLSAQTQDLAQGRSSMPEAVLVVSEYRFNDGYQTVQDEFIVHLGSNEILL